MRASDFPKDATVCFKRLLMQPKPAVPYVREGWFRDDPCSYLGPSALMQRWNFHIRFEHNLLSIPSMALANSRLQVLLIIRPSKGIYPSGNGDGSGNTSSSNSQFQSATTRQSNSRIFSNYEEIYQALFSFTNANNMLLVVQDLGKITFDEQVLLMSQSSLVIGMHGTGIPSAAMHLPIGTKYCCGVIEIFPSGEFLPITGFGNMVRRFGHHYQRLEILTRPLSMPPVSSSTVTTKSVKDENERLSSFSSGSKVSVEMLIEEVAKMVSLIQTQPSCFLPSVLKFPFL